MYSFYRKFGTDLSNITKDNNNDNKNKNKQDLLKQPIKTIDCEIDPNKEKNYLYINKKEVIKNNLYIFLT